MQKAKKIAKGKHKAKGFSRVKGKGYLKKVNAKGRQFSCEKGNENLQKERCLVCKFLMQKAYNTDKRSIIFAKGK